MAYTRPQTQATTQASRAYGQPLPPAQAQPQATQQPQANQMANTNAAAPDTTNERKLTAQERFTCQMISIFEAEAGRVATFTDYEKQLAQHLFLKIDASLKEAESKRRNDNPPITWENVNMRKLAIDAVNRVQLGLDALLPATIYPIAYLNGRAQKYDLDLRVGYRGKLFYRVANAVDVPTDIRLELVYTTDIFVPKPRSSRQPVEEYDFTITQPFDRGQIIGGFAYLIFEEPTKNKLIMVSWADFEKSKNKAGSKDFWNGYEREMCYKTLVHRATDYLYPDPKKVNAAAYAAVEAQDEEASRPPVDASMREAVTIPGEFDETPPARMNAPERYTEQVPEAAEPADPLGDLPSSADF